MSAYDGDRRVVPNRDGSYTLPDPVCGDWAVEAYGNGYIAVSAIGGPVKDPGDRYNQRPQVFASADEAIYAVIGAPE